MSVPIQPMPEYIFVKPDKAIEKTKSGILVPETAQEKPKTSVVQAVGSKVADVKVGDRVIYKDDYQTSNVNIRLDNEDYYIIHKDAVVAVMK